MPNLSDTLLIIIVTTLISVLCFSNQKLLQSLIFSTLTIKKGQIYRFVSHGFVHANPGHLFMNMFTLYFFGRAIEHYYRLHLGSWGFIVFYLLAIVIAIIPSYIANRKNLHYASLGASGAVSAVLFAFVLMAPWSKLYLFAALPIPAIVFAIAYVAYTLYAQKQNRGKINHSAHLWGAAFGIIATLAINPHLGIRFIQMLLNPTF